MENKYSFEVKKHLPPLSWCVIIQEQRCPHIVCGSGVEIEPDCIFEGAWNGEYSLHNFENATFFCGSGMKITSDGVLFASSSHVLEKIVSLKKDDCLYVSNSMPFILSMSGCELDIRYKDYERDFCSITSGLEGYIKKIPLKGEEILNCHFYCNIRVDNNLTVTELKKPVPEDVSDYHNYCSSLLTDLKSLYENASHTQRHHKYGLVSTISSGYDAAACSAMAHEIGCETVLTFNKPIKYESDSGTIIAEILGYKEIICADANAYLSRTDMVEAEHVCSGELGTSIVFSAFEKEFSGKLVFYGERGDKLWDKNWADSNSLFRFTQEVAAGISMAESRLRVNFILVPMPLWRAERWPSIHRISNSPEMLPYSVGGAYDRPIPRRMCEERSVGRTLFGQAKKGAGFSYHFDTISRLKKKMAPASYNDFFSWYRKNAAYRNILSRINYHLKMLPLYINLLTLKLNPSHKTRFRTTYQNNPGIPLFMIIWAVEKMVNRYKNALSEN